MNSSLYSVPQIPLSSTSLKERLKGLARELLEKDPLKMEKTARRVRVLFDNTYLADSTSAYHVWEHEYYPQFYFRTSELQVNYVGREQIGNDDAVSFATYKGLTRSDGTALMFKKGKLAGLTRFEFGQMDAWFEEDQPIYQHPKDPYKRIDILPSTRNVSVKFKNVVIAESNMNMFLFETMLKTRHYMPKTAVNWQYMKPSLKTTICPYKGVAEYYSLRIDGLEIKDAAWWYRNPTRESALIEGMICFYDEKVDVYIDGVKYKA